MPSASPTGTPKHSLRKTTSAEDPKGAHSEGLFMMPPAGVSAGGLRNESVPSTSAKQQGQQATASTGRVPGSPGKRGERWGIHGTVAGTWGVGGWGVCASEIAGL